MSTGKRILPVYTLFDAKAVSGTNTYLSKAVNIQNMDTSALEIVWGAITGTVTILGSVSGKNFLPLPGFTAKSPSGSADGTIIDIWGTGVYWLQLQYVNSSGSGTLTAYIGAKAF